MGTANKQERRFARSKKPQTNYQTATDTATLANFTEFLVSDSNLAKHEHRKEDNQGESNGHHLPTEEYSTVHDTSRQAERRVSSEELGRDLYATLGNVTTTTPDVTNAPTARQHVFKMQDLAASKQSPTITLIEIVGSAINRKLPSMVVEELGMKSSGTGRLSQNMALRGSGLVVTPSGITAEDIETIRLSGLHYFTHQMLKLVVADAGTIANAVDYSAGGNYVESWDFSIRKNLLADQGYVPGAGLYFVAGNPLSGAIRSECLTETYMFAMNFVARLLNDSDQLAALRAKKQLDVSLDLIGPTIATTFKHKLNVHAPRVSYDIVEPNGNSPLVTVQINTKIFFDVATGKDVEFTLTNEVTSYTA